MLWGARIAKEITFQPASGVILVALPEYGEGASYEIPLGDRPTAREVCQWLGHVSEKRWASARRLAGILYAIDQVYGLRSLP